MTKREGGENTLILYHASKEVVEYPEVRKMKYTKDFSWGFYCTKKLDQAVRWANRGEGEPIINIYQYDPDDSLQVLYFETMTEEWLNDFITGKITRKQFWALAEFKYPTHQISFHTLAALDCLKYQRSEVIYDSERAK